MQRSAQHKRRFSTASLARWFSGRAAATCGLACLAMLGAITGARLLRSQAQSPAETAAPNSQTTATTPAASPAQEPGTTPTPAHAQEPAAAPANAQPPAGGQAANPTAAPDPDAAQKQEIAKESAELLKMATALKIEIDKTNQDTLSLSVVRKANEIEQMAHKVRLGGGKS